jgi:hypothetical protein
MLQFGKHCSRNQPTTTFIRQVFFLIYGKGGGGVQAGSLDTSATKWPTVSAPGDYDDGEVGGMKIGRGNRSSRRKPAPTPLCPIRQVR